MKLPKGVEDHGLGHLRRIRSSRWGVAINLPVEDDVLVEEQRCLEDASGP